MAFTQNARVSQSPNDKCALSWDCNANRLRFQTIRGVTAVADYRAIDSLCMHRVAYKSIAGVNRVYTRATILTRRSSMRCRWRDDAQGLVKTSESEGFS